MFNFRRVCFFSVVFNFRRVCFFSVVFDSFAFVFFSIVFDLRRVCFFPPSRLICVVFDFRRVCFFSVVYFNHRAFKFFRVLGVSPNMPRMCSQLAACVQFGTKMGIHTLQGRWKWGALGTGGGYRCTCLFIDVWR